MKKLLVVLAAVFGLGLALLLPQPASAFNLFPDKVCGGDKAKNSTACIEAKAQNKQDNPVAELLGDAANILALAAGVVAVVVIIVAGFQFVTSGGNAEQVTKARGKIIGAIIGLAIIALAWTIIRLVTDYVLQ